ncbi:MAG: ComEC/Rec2 family competence protein, partial [Bacteroidota bacterium]
MGAALLLAAGIALGPYLLLWRLPLALAAIAGGGALAARYWWRRTLPAPLAFFLIAAVGMLLVAPPVPAATAARVTGVRGWFDGEVLARSGRIFQGARLAAWRLGNGPWTAPGRTLRLWVGGAPGGVSAGRRFAARGRLYPSAAAGADGFFYPKRLELLAGPAGFPLRRGALALRAAVDRVYAGSLRPLHRAVLNGLVFGDTAALPPEILRRFADAGAVHLLSVSGLHVGFVILLVLGAARALGRRGWGAWIAAAAAVAGYAVLCGAKPPVVRAAVMGLAAG